METLISSLDQPVIGNILMRHVVSPLMQGKYAMSETALLAIALSLLHVEKNIAATCLLCGNCDPKTLTRWEHDPSTGFPPHHKDPGGTHYWWLDEVVAWTQTHQDIVARVNRRRGGAK